jgi:hypothetical protein
VFETAPGVSTGFSSFAGTAFRSKTNIAGDRVFTLHNNSSGRELKLYMMADIPFYRWMKG